MKKAIATLGALIVASTGLISVVAPGQASTSFPDDKACSLREFKRIERGMSPRRVKRITGTVNNLYTDYGTYQRGYYGGRKIDRSGSTYPMCVVSYKNYKVGGKDWLEGLVY